MKVRSTRRERELHDLIAQQLGRPPVQIASRTSSPPALQSTGDYSVRQRKQSTTTSNAALHLRPESPTTAHPPPTLLFLLSPSPTKQQTLPSVPPLQPRPTTSSAVPLRPQRLHLAPLRRPDISTTTHHSRLFLRNILHMGHQHAAHSAGRRRRSSDIEILPSRAGRADR